jgi:hypothetical protein
VSQTATLFLFVKGTAESAVENLVAQAQCAATLDTLEKVQNIPEIGTRVIATANTELAARAAVLGAQVEIDSPTGDFHWGKRLAALVDKYRATIPFYIGGGSGALMSADDWRAIAQRVLREPNLVITNNFYSCDFAAWSPGNTLAQIEPPVLDNDLAFRLGERAHLQVAALPKNAATQLDIDTPTDLVTISFHPAVGKNLRAFLDLARLDATCAAQIKSLRGNRDATLLIAGRVSASMALFLEHATRCQWRILSEERGMRASGREEHGEVRSLLGFYLEQAGASTLVQMLPRLADAAIIDTRVLFAHHRLHPTAPDRFHSDLMEAEQIGDPFIREFTAAARAAPIPILLGGHSLVSGGMYALAEQ